MRVLKRPAEVCVIVGYELGRYPEQDVHGGIVFPQVVQINISSTLSISQGFTGPDLMHQAGGGFPAPWASPISLLVELELLGPIPDAEGLDCGQLVALCGGESLGGKVEGDLVQRAQSLHSSPVVGQELCMAGSCYAVVMRFNLLVWEMQHVEGEGGPGWW